jgi:hypothetical protein
MEHESGATIHLEAFQEHTAFRVYEYEVPHSYATFAMLLAGYDSAIMKPTRHTIASNLVGVLRRLTGGL